MFALASASKQKACSSEVGDEQKILQALALATRDSRTPRGDGHVVEMHLHAPKHTFGVNVTSCSHRLPGHGSAEEEFLMVPGLDYFYASLGNEVVQNKPSLASAQLCFADTPPGSDGRGHQFRPGSPRHSIKSCKTDKYPILFNRQQCDMTMPQRPNPETIATDVQRISKTSTSAFAFSSQALGQINRCQSTEVVPNTPSCVARCQPFRAVGATASGVARRLSSLVSSDHPSQNR